jgi:probable rRNA maturation factor
VAARVEAVPGGSAVGVLVCDDATMRDYNRRFAGVDRATDVLAFPTEGSSELGDIVLSLDHLRDQAAEAGHSLEIEAATLAVHGFLHLLGHDHARAADRDAMFALTDRIVVAAGFPGAGVSAARSRG